MNFRPIDFYTKIRTMRMLYVRDNNRMDIEYKLHIQRLNLLYIVNTMYFVVKHAPLSILRHLTLNLIRTLLISFQLRLFSLFFFHSPLAGCLPKFGLSPFVFRFTKLLIHSLTIWHSPLLKISLCPARRSYDYRLIALR